MFTDGGERNFGDFDISKKALKFDFEGFFVIINLYPAKTAIFVDFS